MNHNSVYLQPLTPDYFAAVIQLGNQVHGDGYLDTASLTAYYQRGIKNGHNAAVIALVDGELIGFRLVFAPGQWPLDEWCSPALWPVDLAELGYFKCNTVAPAWQGQRIGGMLLQRSIEGLQAQGARAGLAHLWMESPGNAAVRYFSKHGGVLVKIHADKWHADSKAGYCCVRCGHDCHCHAAEMLLQFDPT